MSSTSSSNLQDPYCQICFTSYSPNTPSPVVLQCGSSTCQDCILEWLVTRIRGSHQNHLEIRIPCVSSTCKDRLGVEEISSQLTNEHQTKLNEELFQAYVNSQEDIRRCPRINCPYAGVITPKPCKGELQCGLCSATWTDKAQQTKTHKILSNLKRFVLLKNEIFSSLWKILFSKKCPGCRCSIEKDEGCEHITCLKCGHEFCWVCPSKYPTHNDTAHKAYCALIIIVWLTIAYFTISYFLSFMFILPPIKFILDWTVVPVWRYIVSWVTWTKHTIAWCFWISRDFLMFNWILMGFGNAFLVKEAKLLGKFVGFLTGCFFCYIIYYFEIVWPVVKFGLCECFFVFVISLVEKTVKRFSKKPSEKVTNKVE